jgi:hypothetical protein
VQGQYRVAAETAKARAQAEARAAQAAQAEERQRRQQSFQAEQNQLNRDAVTGRQQFTQGRLDARAAGGREAVAGRMEAAANARRAQAIRTGKEQAPGASFPWGFLGMGRSQDDANSELLQSLEPPMGGGADDDVMTTAQTYLPHIANMDEDDIADFIEQSQPDASPDELSQLFQAVVSLRGVQ